MEADVSREIEPLTRRKVTGFMSENHIDPDLAVEVFVLEPLLPLRASAHPDPSRKVTFRPRTPRRGQASSNPLMSVRSSASRNVSTETSCSTSVSDKNTLTLRPVACSTTLVKPSAIAC
jgi:hypothetical protein